MPPLISPKKFHERILNARKQSKRKRSVRTFFLEALTGSYYNKDTAREGTQPLNLIAGALKTLLPNLVMNSPTATVHSEFIQNRFYADILGRVLTANGKKLKLARVYRTCIMDAFFAPFGIMKTGISESNQLIHFNEQDSIDPGEVFTANVDFDNFVTDPAVTTNVQDGLFIGDRIVIPRQMVLDSGLYDNDLIVRVPTAGNASHEDRAEDLSRREVKSSVLHDFQDEIALYECYLPHADALITIPESPIIFEDYLRVEDYSGPDTGPYTLLELGLPVPGNAYRMDPVASWYDLHILANRMVQKTVQQAEASKRVVGYNPGNTDDAETLRTAEDTTFIAMEDPNAAQVFDLQLQSPEAINQVANLQAMFNQASGNPQAIGGQTLGADSATEANILNQNISTILEDMKDMVVEVVSKGDMMDPDLTLRSKPPLSQREILSRMVFNKSLADISPFQSKEIARSIKNLGKEGGYGGGICALRNDC